MPKPNNTNRRNFFKKFAAIPAAAFAATSLAIEKPIVTGGIDLSNPRIFKGVPEVVPTFFHLNKAGKLFNPNIEFDEKGFSLLLFDEIQTSNPPVVKR